MHVNVKHRNTTGLHVPQKMYKTTCTVYSSSLQQIPVASHTVVLKFNKIYKQKKSYHNKEVYGTFRKYVLYFRILSNNIYIARRLIWQYYHAAKPRLWKLKMDL